MIIDLKKYLFIGTSDDLDLFFERAQKQGFIEFTSASAKKTLETPPQVQQLISAHKILRQQPIKPPYTEEGGRELALQVAARIVELKAECEKFSEEKRLLSAEIARVAPFGDFSLDDVDYVEREGKRKIQFFCRKSGLGHEVDELIYIATDYDLDYFVSISRAPIVPPGMIEMRIDRPLGLLQSHLTFVEEALYQLEAELKGFAGHIDFLYEALLEELSEHQLLCAKKEVQYPLGNALFAIEAWVPESKVKGLFPLLQGVAVHAEPIAPQKDERSPTYMENRGVARIGEDLVYIYDIPAVVDRDPSIWVFWAFVLFFSIIVADAGYGLLYLAVCLSLRWKFPHWKGGASRFLKLATILSIGCVIWGTLIGSFFGISIAPESWLGKTSITQYLAEQKATYHFRVHDETYAAWVKENPDLAPLTDGEEIVQKAVTITHGKIHYKMFEECRSAILIEFSLLIGTIHVSLSLLRYLWRHVAGLGWVAFLVGGYLYFPSILGATSLIHYLGWIDKATANSLGLQLIWSGVCFAVVAALIQKRFKGLGEISTGIQVFSDVLSYLRLYALGFAGIIMAETFNDIGEGVGLVFGFLIIILGHGINILMGLMAGVIHGLRLNFLEWYHYCFTGGGRRFNPLRILRSIE